MSRPLNLNNYSDRQRFYKRKQWINIRKHKLSLNPFCELCSEKNKPKFATEIDHIEPIEESPEKALLLDNLQSLCKSCHSKKTYEEKLKGSWSKSRTIKKKEKYNLDNWPKL